MAGQTRYVLLSLPLGVFDSSSDKEEAIEALRATVSADSGHVLPFRVPDFKIGTLDALVQQAEDLAKLEATCQSVVAKVADSLRSVLGSHPDRTAQYKMVNDSPSLPDLACRRAPADGMSRADGPVPEQLHLE